VTSRSPADLRLAGANRSGLPLLEPIRSKYSSCLVGMTHTSHRDVNYLFGHSDSETRRLQVQAALFNPATSRMLLDAGITQGMRVLDVGSGAGDVALLVAELVGPDGQVVGVESNPLILESARARVQAAGLGNVSFVVGDISTVPLEGEFDAAVGRCVLFFISDPVAVVRKVAQLVRPGGSIAFQEPGNASHPPVALPASPLMEQMWSWIMELYRRTGMDLYMGMHLYPIFVAAGLAGPSMHLDAAVGGGPEWVGYEYMAGLVRTLLPRFVAAGIATANQVDIDTFADRLRAEIVGHEAVATTWSFVTAWTRKSL
jgi:SAM-dependent methyltransferase